MSGPLLRSSTADGVRTLTLNRPDKRNALSAALIAELHGALDGADVAPDVRVVCLRGAGPDFCAGADLAELLASRDRTLAENESDALGLGRLFLRCRELPIPVVAVVQGRALAGGAGLAAAADIVLAADDAQFGFPEILRGFVPAMVMALLRRQVGERLAFDLVATGRSLGASEARAAGLVTRVAPAGELESAAADLLAELAGRPRSAMAFTKRLFHELDGLGLANGIAAGARVNAASRATPEFRDAISAFLTK